MPIRPVVLLLAGFGLAGARQPPPELVVSGDFQVPATLNGQAGRLRIDPAAPAMPVLTAAYAARATLRPGPFAFAFLVGPQRVQGATAVAQIGVGTAEVRRRRVGWTERAFAQGVDGAVGPGGLDAPIVRFVLHDPQPGERTLALPLADEGGLFGGWGGAYALIEVGGAPMRVRFDPFHPRTLATAGAAARLAAANDGRIGGESEMTEIAFGISRPVRSLRLGRPLAVGPLAIDLLGVRTGDFGSTAAIREQDADPDEILVAANRRHDPHRDRLAIGADLLSRCSALTFDRPAHQVRLTCR